jgi:hypothetical protein
LPRTVFGICPAKPREVRTVGGVTSILTLGMLLGRLSTIVACPLVRQRSG